MTLRASRWLMAGGLVLTFFVGGCGGDEVSDIPYGTAAAMVEQSLQDAITALAPARPKNEQTSEITEVPCGQSFGSAGDSDNKVAIIERTYHLTGIDYAANNQAFDRLQRHWASHGYRLIRDDGPKGLDETRWMDGKREDGFFMTLIQGVTGPLTLRAQSVCVRRTA